jgi:hypothetical protein
MIELITQRNLINQLDDASPQIRSQTESTERNNQELKLTTDDGIDDTTLPFHHNQVPSITRKNALETILITHNLPLINPGGNSPTRNQHQTHQEN